MPLMQRFMPFMLSLILMNVNMQNVVMLNVVAHFARPTPRAFSHFTTLFGLRNKQQIAKITEITLTFWFCNICVCVCMYVCVYCEYKYIYIIYIYIYIYREREREIRTHARTLARSHTLTH